MSKVSVWADEDLLEHLKQKIDALIISTRNVKSEKMIMNEKASRFKKLVTNRHANAALLDCISSVQRTFSGLVSETSAFPKYSPRLLPFNDLKLQRVALDTLEIQ
jgi:hypothetical protein